jgi:hypothetical protein
MTIAPHERFGISILRHSPDIVVLRYALVFEEHLVALKDTWCDTTAIAGFVWWRSGRRTISELVVGQHVSLLAPN